MKVKFFNKDVYRYVVIFLSVTFLWIGVISLAQAREQSSPLDPIRKLYNEGEINEARTKAVEYLDFLFLPMQTRSFNSSDAQTRMAELTIAVATLAEMEYKIFDFGRKQQDESSSKFLDYVVQLMEKSSKLVENMNGYSARSEKERDTIEFIKNNRILAIKRQIVLSDSKRAENLFKQHEKLLTMRGLRLEDIVKENLATLKGFEPADSQLVDTAKKELDLFKATLSTYYNSLVTQNIVNLRQILSKETPTETAKNILKKIEHERDVEKDFDELLFIGLDEESRINVLKEINRYVVVRVTGVNVVIMKDGKKKTLRQSDMFNFVKEEGKWRIWYRK